MVAPEIMPVCPVCERILDGDVERNKVCIGHLQSMDAKLRARGWEHLGTQWAQYSGAAVQATQGGDWWDRDMKAIRKEILAENERGS